MKYTDIEKIANQYARTFDRYQKDIVEQLLSGKTYSLVEKRRILREIQAILSELEEKSDIFIEKNVEKMYKTGVKDAVKIMTTIGVVSYILNNRQNESITNLTEVSKVSMQEAISGMYKSSSRILSKATEQRLKGLLAEGRISSDTYKQMVYTITQSLKDQRVFILDSAGRKWDVENYAKMFVRTDSMKAYNTGISDEMLKEGEDLAYVTSYASCKCDICLAWENKVLSLSGKNKKYPSLDGAYASGLFHPNCKHRLRPL
jgi:hypothetical protein